ncbi:MAG: DUF3131 domain-containing protein [Rhodobacteraceae bacterium]|nr:DUF3131 domain-containing protein [Paracoccaceae bacterium]
MALLRFLLVVGVMLLPSPPAQPQWKTLTGLGGPVPEILTPEEIQFARTAWQYFVVNENPETGLVSAVNNFPSTTLWDEGGYLLAMTAAYRLGLITRKEASARLSRVLDSLARIPLFRGQLPNKVYNTKTLKMTDYTNKVTETGVGWSALDIMRLVSGMLVATQEFPEHQVLAQHLINRWELPLLVNAGRFQGIAVRGKAQGQLVQEGRIGYEQYAGQIGLLVGLPVKLAAQYGPILRHQKYRDILIPGDIRTKSTHGVSSVTTSEPFLLEALEVGWTEEAHLVASAVYAAQFYRWRETGTLTSLSEDHIKGKPYFAYNALLVDYTAFVSVTAKRVDVSAKRGFSTKASFGWWALMRDPYSKQLLDAVKHLQSERGWYAGLFEADGSPNEILTLNTNAVVLEALHYKVFGPLYRR